MKAIFAAAAVVALCGCHKGNLAVGTEHTSKFAGREITLRFKPHPGYACTYRVSTQIGLPKMDAETVSQFGNEETQKALSQDSHATITIEIRYRVQNVSTNRIEVVMQTRVLEAKGSGAFTGMTNTNPELSRERQRFYNEFGERTDVDTTADEFGPFLIAFPKDPIKIGEPFLRKRQQFGISFVEEYVAEDIEPIGGKEVVRIVKQVRDEDQKIIGITKAAWFELDTGLLVKAKYTLDFSPSDPNRSGLWFYIDRS